MPCDPNPRTSPPAPEAAEHAWTRTPCRELRRLARLDPNTVLQGPDAVGTPGPELHTASSGPCGRARLDPNTCEIECQKDCQIECQNICQTECQKECQIDCQNICQVFQVECQNICQVECQVECQHRCQRECQNECLKKCKKECQNICQSMSAWMPDR